MKHTPRVAAPRFTRRQWLQAFGPAALVLLPVARSMGYVAGGSFAGSPRYVMFFRGASFHSPTIHDISSLDALGGTPLEALAPHQRDLILFHHMSITGGEPKSSDYQEEHGGGLLGCVTGNSYKYYENDSYMAYTDHESFDVMLANHYLTKPALAALPFPSLHLGGGARSDCDSCGLGQRYISFRKRQSGDDYYSNAIEPIQSASQVYDLLMERINTLCASNSAQPGADDSALKQALARKKKVLDLRLTDLNDAKRTLGMDAEHTHKLDGLLEGWHRVEATLNAEVVAAEGGGTSAQSCPEPSEPNGRGDRSADCDDLSPVHDQMIDLIQLAFAWDLTRVVAFTLSGASSGHTWSSQGINQAHHSLEHAGNVAGLNTMGTYFAGKYARLLDALKQVDDGNGETALRNSAVLLGMECWSDGGHYLRNIPFILAGQAGGRFETGRIVDAKGRSNNDLYVSIQNAAELDSDVFGAADLCEGPIV
jgi:hypothetical protein